MDHTLCCLDTVYPIGDTTACCGVDIYRAHIQSCCRGEITDNVPQLFSVCCSGTAYDKRKVECLSGVPTGRCSERGEEDVEESEAAGGEQSSPAQAYDVRQLVCCEGKLYPLNSKRACCGSRYLPSNACIGRRPVSRVAYCSGVKYMESEKHCCEGVLHKFRRGSQCCRSMYYNRRTQRCVQGSVVDIEVKGPRCLNKPYSPSRHKCCDDTKLHMKRPGFVCCGSDYILPNKYTRCEKGEVVMMRQAKQCKGDSSNGKKKIDKDSNKYVCCDGKYFRKHFTRKCCGDRYVIKSKTCESNVIPSKPEDYDSGIGGGASGEERRCGRRVYTIGERVCCGGQSMYIEREGFACCGTRYYRTSSAYYCSAKGELERRAVCGPGITYDSAGQVCCRASALKIRKASKNKKGDKATEDVNPKVYSKEKGYRCCGRLYIYSEKFSCHSGIPKEKKRQDSSSRSGGRGSDDGSLTGLGLAIPSDQSGLLGLLDDLSEMGIDLNSILRYLEGLGVDTSGLDISGALNLGGVDWSGLQLGNSANDDSDEDSEEADDEDKSSSKKGNKKSPKKNKKDKKKPKNNSNKSKKNNSKDRS